MTFSKIVRMNLNNEKEQETPLVPFDKARFSNIFAFDKVMKRNDLLFYF